MRKANKDEKALVSVIIPTYNRVNLLHRAIKSVLKQTYQIFELIIVDDGSSDNTDQVVTNFSDSRIHYIRLNNNRGKSIALNEGIKASKGEFLIFLDDDDEFLPQLLEIEVDAIRNTTDEVGFVFGLGKIIRKQRISYFNRKNYQKKDDLFKAQLQFCALTHLGVLIKKKCLERVGYFNESLFFGIDWEFMLRLLKHFEYIRVNRVVCKVHYEDPLNVSHISEDTKSKIPNRLRTYKILLKDFYYEISQSKTILAKHYFRIAHTFYKNNDFKYAKKYFKLAFKTNPINFRYIFYHLLVHFRKKLNVLNITESLISQKFENWILPKIRIQR